MKDKLEIKSRIQVNEYPAHWDSDFWKNTFIEAKTENVKYFDVILNGKIVASYSFEPHAKEWIHNYKKTVKNKKLVDDYEVLKKQMRMLEKEYNFLVNKHPWLYDHKLKFIK